MNYLGRLLKLEEDKKLAYTPDTVPAKPTKAPFDGFGGSPHRHIENISEFDKPVNLEASRKPLCQSKLTYAPVDIDLHKEELNRLVLLVSNHHGFSKKDYEEALTHALRDPVSALTCFTSLARQAELI
jgi:hypothetical protein